MYTSPTNICPGVQLERDQMMLEEQIWAQMYGDDVTIRFNQEASVGRDKYQSIKTKSVLLPTTLVLRAYPIIYSPTKYQMEKAGIQEQVNVIITLPMKSLRDNGVDETDLNAIKAEIQLRNETYTITDKSPSQQIADEYVKINLGLFRKS